MGGLKEEEKQRPDRIGAPEVREMRRCRLEGPSKKCGRGVEGICPAHLSLGILLGSQVKSPAL